MFYQTCFSWAFGAGVLETLLNLLPPKKALISLPLAAVLGSALAFRIRRRGTPPRSLEVIQSQIILAVIGALIILVVDDSLARAFGVVGIAGLIRYRVKIEDPKEAGVMLATLGIGVAAGAGLYALSVFATVFTMALLLIMESFEPAAYRLFNVKITTKDPIGLQPKAEDIMRDKQINFELHGSSSEELRYEVHMPFGQSTDEVINAIVNSDGAEPAEVELKETERVPRSSHETDFTNK